jgi:tRNA1(Val) A37 N6-methylase TrmN6
MDPFTPLWPDGPLFAPAPNAPLCTDSVLLADFVHIRGTLSGIDLGCASGAILLMLLSRSERLRMTGIELQPDAAELAVRAMERNGYTDRAEILCGDLREYRTLLPGRCFDFVVSNPPYFPPGTGALSPNRARADARSELSCTLEDLCITASAFCRTGGSFYLVHKPERLSEIFVTLNRTALEPKRLRAVCSRPGRAPSLVLIEARKGGKPGLKIEPALILQTDTGEESKEYRRIYHRE